MSTQATDASRHSLFHEVARLVRQAASIFRVQWVAVIVVASVVVLGPTVLVALLEQWLEHHEETAGNLALALAGALVVAALSTMGSTFLAGLLDRLAGHHIHGHPFHGFAHTLRTLPYGRLVLADLLVSTIVLLGIVLFVVPGLVAYTFLALVGPLIIIEDLGVMAAIRRSAQLVRSAFWLVVLSVTSVTLLEVAVEEAFEHAGWTDDLPGELLVSFLLGVLAGSFAALMKVCAAYEIRGREIEGEGGST